MSEPKGLVAVFTDEDGRHIASVTDFHKDRPGGFKMIEAQRHRVRDALAWKVIEAYASPNLTRAIADYDRKQILDRLVRDHKCTVKIIPVGYTDDEASIL